MTRGSIREYTEAVQGRYLRATKKEKARMLDEFTQVTDTTARRRYAGCAEAASPSRASAEGAPAVMVPG